MRKMLLITMLLLSFASIAFARIDRAELSAGGVSIGQKFSDVTAVYGQPVQKKPYGVMIMRNGSICSFAGKWAGFEVLVNNNTGEVAGMFIRNSDISTIAGIKIGATLDNVKAVYGKPDSDIKTGPVPFIGYICEFEKNIGVQMSFYYDSNSVVKIDMQPWYDFAP